MKGWHGFPVVIALAVLAIGAALSATLSAWHAQQNEAIARQQLALRGTALAESLRLRIANFKHGLLGLRGALAGDGERASRYRSYADVIVLEKEYPGALAFGYAERVAQKKVPALLDQLGKKSGQAVTLKTVNVNNGDRFVVIEASGEMALGTDLASLALVREAGMRATWSADAVLSPPLYGNPEQPPGYYYLLPVYKADAAPDSASDRAENVAGWLFVHLSGERLMSGIADESLNFRLIDRDNEDNEFLVFDAAKHLAERNDREVRGLLQEFEQKFGGRTWHFSVTPMMPFWVGLGQIPPTMSFSAGAALSALAAFIAYILLTLRSSAVALAEKMTSALRVSEQRQRTIFEYASIGIALTRDRIFQHCNPRFAEIYGWESPGELEGMPGLVVWPSADDYRDVGQCAGPILASGGVYSVERAMRRKDGSVFLAQILAKATNPADTAAGTIWIAEDVTEKHAVERAIKESERQLAQIVDGSSIATFVIDAEQRVTHWNKACTNLTGLSAAEILGRTDVWKAFYPEPRPTMSNLIVSGSLDETVAEHYKKFAHSALIAGAIDAESYFPQMGEGGRWLYFTAAPLRDSQGKITGAIETLQDITERRFAEKSLEDRTEALQKAYSELGMVLENLQNTQDELVRSEKLAALGSIVAGVAHELNTPIGNSVMVASHMNEASIKMNEAIKGGLTRSMLDKYLAEVSSASSILLRNLHKAAELVSSFKQVAVDQTSSQRRTFPLTEVVSEIITMLTPSLRMTPYVLERDVADDISLDSYPGPLGQILMNLINNAMLHGFEGREHGTIRIGAARSADGNRVVLTVGDSGKGIPEDVLPRIFDPFFTTKLGSGGSGLGLNITHNMVSGILGGRIAVTSTVGVGTTFTLSLPLKAPMVKRELS